MKTLNRRSFAALGGAALFPRAAHAETYDLATLPPGAIPHRVTAVPAEIKGRKALKVELDAKSRAGQPGVDFGDTDTFVMIPTSFLPCRKARPIRSLSTRMLPTF